MRWCAMIIERISLAQQNQGLPTISLLSRRNFRTNRLRCPFNNPGAPPEFPIRCDCIRFSQRPRQVIAGRRKPIKSLRRWNPTNIASPQTYGPFKGPSSYHRLCR